MTKRRLNLIHLPNAASCLHTRLPKLAANHRTVARPKEVHFLCCRHSHQFPLATRGNNANWPRWHGVFLRCCFDKLKGCSFVKSPNLSRIRRPCFRAKGIRVSRGVSCIQSQERYNALTLPVKWRTINSKINGTPKGVYSPISNLRTILAVAIFLHTITYGYVIMCK